LVLTLSDCSFAFEWHKNQLPIREDSNNGYPARLFPVARIPVVGGVVGTVTLPVDVIWPVPGVVAGVPVAPPDAAAIAGAVVAGAPWEIGGASIKLGFSRVSRERTDRRVRFFMGSLNRDEKEFQLTQDSIPAIVSLFGD
jgi:hypothetical protein